MSSTRFCYYQLKRKRLHILSFVSILLVTLICYYYTTSQQPGTGLSSLGITNVVLLEQEIWDSDSGRTSKDGSDSLVDKNIHENPSWNVGLEFSEELAQGRREQTTTNIPLNAYNLDNAFPSKYTERQSGKELFPLRGVLNHHIWQAVCNYQVQSLREFILFPEAPSKRRFVTSFQSNFSEKHFGQRIFGYLLPDKTGQYRLAISSSGNSELWLSSDDSSGNLRKIAYLGSRGSRGRSVPGDYMHLPSQVSDEFNLEGNTKYFIDVVHKQSSGKAHLEVAWLRPGSTYFTLITSEFIRAVKNDTYVRDDSVELSDYNEMTRRTHDINLPFVEHWVTKDILTYCSYEPSYLVRHKLVRFQGARNKSNTHFAAIYPPDTTNNSLSLVQNEDIWWRENAVGNKVTDPSVANDITKMFMEMMDLKYPGVYQLQKITSVEQVADSEKGDRFLLELQLIDRRTGGSMLLSEHVYKPRRDNNLCYPEGFRWSRNATVNIIVPIRKSARWALYFIRNIAEIAQQTGDRNIHVILVDYESSDIDIEGVLGKSSIPWYTLVRVPAEESFQRALSLQRGANVVKDPHSILFMCDLHLKIPAHLIPTIRKHCVEGKMAFAPVVKRLRCGYYPDLPFGYWETLGFGLFAMFKSDFDRVGGMNIKEFTGWGGEDWELLDRVLMFGLEVERLKIPDFYHFYHPPFGGSNQRIGA